MLEAQEFTVYSTVHDFSVTLPQHLQPLHARFSPLFPGIGVIVFKQCHAVVISLVLKSILFELKGMIPSSNVCQDSGLLNYRSKAHTCTQVVDRFTDIMD